MSLYDDLVVAPLVGGRYPDGVEIPQLFAFLMSRLENQTPVATLPYSRKTNYQTVYDRCGLVLAEAAEQFALNISSGKKVDYILVPALRWPNAGFIELPDFLEFRVVEPENSISEWQVTGFYERRLTHLLNRALDGDRLMVEFYKLDLTDLREYFE